MKKILLLLLSLSATFAGMAKGLDLQSKVMLQRNAVEKARLLSAPTTGGSETVLNPKAYRPTPVLPESGTVMGFVKIEDGYSSDDLRDAGFSVLAVRGNVAIVAMPLDSVNAFAELPAVAKLSLQREVKTHMEKERAVSGIDDIHNGVGLDMPYTGKNVMACIVDQGVDPNHVAFLDDKGKSRVTYLSYFDGTADRDGVPYYYLYGDEIYDINDDGSIYWYPTVDKFTTDEVGAYHGTHTLNILGGGYKGNISYSRGEFMGSIPLLPTKKNTYYGVAPDAQLAVSCGELQDACIAFGLNGLLDYAAYAKEVAGMPAVASLSLGSTAGPHDPNNLMNTFLDECGDDAIVVLSAGNEGDLKIALNKNFTADDNSVKTFIYPYHYRYDPTQAKGQYNTYIRQGAVLIYSNDDTPFNITGYVLEYRNGSWRKNTLGDLATPEGVYYSSSSYYTDYVGGSVSNILAKYFDGYVGGGAMLDQTLGRYYGVFDYYLFTNPDTALDEDGNEKLIIGFEVTGSDGQRIELYCDGINTWMDNYGVEGWDDGSTDGTISDMAVGKNVLVVGSYNTNLEWYSLDGKRYWYDETNGFEPDDITFFSSYGTLADGRTLPHVCAPGSAVISAMSTPYIESYYKGYEQYIPMNVQAKATYNGRTYYWKQESGTSMSTPLVAGAIALWLEADPTLTINDVKDIIAKTSKSDEYVKKGNPARWGAGKFDALAGLKEVISRASVNDITVDGHNDRLILTPKGGNVFNVFVGDSSTLKIAVNALNGSTVFSQTFGGNEADIDLSNLTKGIYVITANGHSKKITIN